MYISMQLIPNLLNTRESRKKHIYDYFGAEEDVIRGV